MIQCSSAGTEEVGHCSQTVTLSDPYWNSQPNNSRTLTNLILSYDDKKNNSFGMIKKWKIKVYFATLKVLNTDSTFFQANMNSFIVHILSEKAVMERVVLVHNNLRPGKYSNRVLL